jgi:hypothetical protein
MLTKEKYYSLKPITEKICKYIFDIKPTKFGAAGAIYMLVDLVFRCLRATNQIKVICAG